MDPTIIVFIILIIAAAGGLIYWSMNKGSTKTKTTLKKNSAPSGGDTILISNSGSKKETFIDSPHRFCDKSDPPSWCSKFPLTEPISYWYDVENFDGISPTFKLIDETTGECVNPSDCIKFTEVLDSGMNLVDIKSPDGKSLITTLIDDVYSGKLKVPAELLLFVDIDFDTGVLSAAPLPDGTIPKDKDGIVLTIIPGENFPIGMYVALLVFKYKEAGKPKPNIKFQFKSDIAGEILKKMERLG
jgi:hypothetical protein